MLGRRIDHEVGAKLERTLQDRGREHVVDDHLGTGPVGEFGDRGDVDQLERRVARGLEEHEPGRPLQGRGPGIEIGAVDQHGLDPEARQELGQDVVAGAEQQARRDHPVARLELAHERGVDRGHAGRGRGRLLGTFEQRQALLEHAHGRIGEPRVGEARLMAGEALGGVLGPPVAVARGQEQGLGGLAELGARAAAVDRPGPGPPSLTHRRFLPQRKTPRPSARAPCDPAF